VVQTATVLAGPMVGRLLADWGADVILVEPVRGGIRGDTRRKAADAQTANAVDPAAENLNRNKRGIALDLSQSGGRDVLHRILTSADVLVSNFRPRDLARLGLDYPTLSGANPRLIHANLTGYGRDGPDRDVPSYGILAFFARAGIQYLMEQPGVPPATAPASLPDMCAALSLAYGIMLALFMRERTGRGQEVDTSLFRTGVFAISPEVAWGLSGQQQERRPSRNFYLTKDGRWACVSRVITGSDEWWASLCRAIDRPEMAQDPRFLSPEARVQNAEAMFGVIEGAIKTRTLAEWTPILNASGVPWAPVQDISEVVADPQARANDFFVPYQHPAYGRTELVANPVRLSGTRLTLTRPAPSLGQHTGEILRQSGFRQADIDRLREARAVA
jgi:formyl-CoA transferase